jgi:hypothetical protein
MGRYERAIEHLKRKTPQAAMPAFRLALPAAAVSHPFLPPSQHQTGVIQKWALNVTAHGRLASFDLFLPVNAAFGHPLDALVAAIDAVFLR